MIYLKISCPINYFINSTFTFLLLPRVPLRSSGQAKKSNKKRAPKKITSFFREGALIELLHYCSFNFTSLKTHTRSL
jgi:hypothetical protein